MAYNILKNVLIFMKFDTGKKTQLVNILCILKKNFVVGVHRNQEKSFMSGNFLKYLKIITCEFLSVHGIIHSSNSL